MAHKNCGDVRTGRRGRYSIPNLLATISTGREQLEFPARYPQVVSRRSASTGTNTTTNQNSATPVQRIQRNINSAERIVQDVSSMITAIDLQKHPYTETDVLRTGRQWFGSICRRGHRCFIRRGVSETDVNRLPGDYLGDSAVGVTQSLLRGAGLKVNLVASGGRNERGGKRTSVS